MSRHTPDPHLVPNTKEALLALKGGPVIVGPWLSEIGFELLYWIPFLRWACDFARLKPEDLWIVSRGGCRSWYADISTNYVDILDFYSPDHFRAGNARRMAEQAEHYDVLALRHGRTSTKQHMSTSFDRSILAQVTKATGIPATRMLHPSLMYKLFRAFWRRRSPYLYRDMTIPRRLTPPPRIDGLPASYVAAKFYASQACDNRPIHATLVNECVNILAAHTDVVLLHSGTRYDDHGEFAIAPHPRVHRIAMTPATNLETQTAVIGHASAYVGTYGGFAYLAPFLGVRARTFYARPNFRRDHRQVIDQVCASALRTSFSVELIGGSPVAKRRKQRAA